MPHRVVSGLGWPEVRPIVRGALRQLGWPGVGNHKSVVSRETSSVSFDEAAVPAETARTAERIDEHVGAASDESRTTGPGDDGQAVDPAAAADNEAPEIVGSSRGDAPEVAVSGDRAAPDGAASSDRWPADLSASDGVVRESPTRSQHASLVAPPDGPGDGEAPSEDDDVLRSDDPGVPRDENQPDSAIAMRPSLVASAAAEAGRVARPDPAAIGAEDDAKGSGETPGDSDHRQEGRVAAADPTAASISAAPARPGTDDPSAPESVDAGALHEAGFATPVDEPTSETGHGSGISAAAQTDDGAGGVDTPLPVEETTRPASRSARRSAPTLPAPPEARVITVANQKGGVGKTTTAVNLAASMAQAGLRVLVIDTDPQGNASTALGIDHRQGVPSIYDVLVEETPLAEVVQECPDIPGLACAPATIDLAGAEVELISFVARETRLQRAVTAYLSTEDPPDYILIDCPPSLGLLTLNAFVAGREVLIPIQCEYYALEGLSMLLKNIDMIKRHLNPGLHVSAILLTMYDGRTRLSSQVADEVRDHFPELVFKTRVPRSVRISEAPSHGLTVMSYDPTSTGAMSYAEAAAELASMGGVR